MGVSRIRAVALVPMYVHHPEGGILTLRPGDDCNKSVITASPSLVCGQGSPWADEALGDVSRLCFLQLGAEGGGGREMALFPVSITEGGAVCWRERWCEV